MLQRNIQTHIVAPFDTSFNLSDKEWIEILQRKEAELFNTIYTAAKKKDKYELEKVRYLFCVNHDSLLKDFCFNFFYKGYTPFYLLVEEGDNDSIGFLFECLLNISMESIEKDYVQEIKNKFNESNDLHLINVGKLQLIVEHLFQYGKLIVDNFSEKEMAVINLYVFAMSGDLIKFKEFLIKIKKDYAGDLLLIEIINMAILFAAKHGQHDIVNIFWQEGNTFTKSTALAGFLGGGYINQFKKYYHSLSYLETLKIIYFMLKESVILLDYNAYHKSILSIFMVALKDYPRMRLLFFPQIINEKTHHLKLFNSVNKIDYFINKYHINYDQAFLFCVPELFTWMIQGIQLIKQGDFSLDIFIKILTYVARPNIISEPEAYQFFYNVSYVTHRLLLNEDLNQYLSGVYVSNRHHWHRAKSFQAACNEVDVRGLGGLVANQYGLFSGSVKGNDNSRLKHEHQLANNNKDRFYSILEKHHQRII